MLSISKSQVSFNKEFSYESCHFEVLRQHSHRPSLRPCSGFISIASLLRNNERKGERVWSGKWEKCIVGSGTPSNFSPFIRRS